MHVTLLMDIRYTCQCLEHYYGYLLVIERLIPLSAFLHLLKEVTVGIFKDNVNFIVFFVMNHFFQLYQENALI